ncbi:MAG: N-acetyl-gamma-glutamyl-phosphate reductase, partial [Chloroflexota bacterium]|nr:N-acetyl-gamma-glutamyl-phosphate reductase [Chloroflexota bacterium]
MLRASIVGGSGYVGGELLRVLLGHPEVEVQEVTSHRYVGRYVYNVHPNLRGVTRLQFTTLEALQPSDLLFLALPHGHAAQQIDHFATLATRIIDLSADFRLCDPALYRRWYGWEHSAPEWLERFVYGLPELNREALQGARYASGVGCNATAVNLGLLPFAEQGLIARAVVEVKVGSSEGGNHHSLASHHPERSGAVRSFAPTGHRHQAEMFQVLGDVELHFSATAIEMVRGVLCTAHLFLTESVEERDVWRILRGRYGEEPFIRLVKDRTSLYRYPEPKILAGTNFCDVGFERDPHA